MRAIYGDYEVEGIYIPLRTAHIINGSSQPITCVMAAISDLLKPCEILNCAPGATEVVTYVFKSNIVRFFPAPVKDNWR
jgi:hypothetical protein